MTVDLSGIKLYSEANFANVSSTDDDKLYFVEEGSGGTITEYSSGTSGYLIFPSGMCIQWGQTTVTTNGAAATQNLTKTYANTNYAVLVNWKSASGAANGFCSYGVASSVSKVQVGYYARNQVVYWMTIGQLASGQY